MYFNLDEKGQGQYRENDRTSVFVSFKMGQENILSKKREKKENKIEKKERRTEKGQTLRTFHSYTHLE